MPGAMQSHRLRNPNFCIRFNAPINRIFSFLMCFYQAHKPEPKKVTKSYERVTKSYERVTKSYKKLRKSYETVTKSYKKL